MTCPLLEPPALGSQAAASADQPDLVLFSLLELGGRGSLTSTYDPRCKAGWLTKDRSGAVTRVGNDAGSEKTLRPHAGSSGWVVTQERGPDSQHPTPVETWEEGRSVGPTADPPHGSGLPR